jgi:YidC/Oxa1 family membrane protein insertase
MSMLYGIPLTGAYHVVTWVSTILTPALGALAATAAIVVFTCLVRLLIMPLSYRAMRGQAAQAKLAPQVRELRQRHRKDPERMQRELGELYRREGTSMLAGFGPLLAQAPFLSVVYLLFRSPQVAGHQNTLLTRSLLHVPLGMHWLSGAGPASIQGLVFLGVFAALVGIGLLSTWLATRTAPAGSSPGGAWLPRLLPLVTVAFAAFSPLATGIYLTTTTAWTLLERRVLLRRALPAEAGSAAPVPAPARARRASLSRMCSAAGDAPGSRTKIRRNCHHGSYGSSIDRRGDRLIERIEETRGS